MTLELKKKIFITTTGLLIFTGIFLSVESIRNTPLEYDGAYNLQIAVNLIKHGSYATNGALYAVENLKVFDPLISTGPSTLMPITLFFKLFGIGVVQFRLVMVAFYLATIAALCVLCFRKTQSPWSFLPGLLFMVMLPGFDPRVAAVGEIPATLFLILSIYSLEKHRYPLSGLLAAFAMLSKIITGFVLPVIVFYLATECFGSWKPKLTEVRKFLSRGAIWLIFFLIPIISFEIYHYFSFGNRHGFKASWIEMIKFFKTSGSGIQAQDNGLTIWKKLGAFLIAMHPEHLMIAVLLLGLIVACVANHKKLGKVLWQQRAWVAFVAIYIGWWILKADRLYFRHIVPAFVVFLFVASVIIIKSLGKINALYARTVVMVSLTFVATIGLFQEARLTVLQPGVSLHDQQVVANKINSLSDKKVYHIGWWQNPEIVFLSGKPSRDIVTNPQTTPYYLLLSPANLVTDKLTFSKGEEHCTKTLLSLKDYLLCEADGVVK